MGSNSAENKLNGKVALVTGASRGIGKGVAEVLVSAGATVYITGRKHEGKSTNPSVMNASEELNNVGPGKCIGVYCDHKDDSQVNDLFSRIVSESGRLDVLVNNAFAGLDLKKDFSSSRFWEQDAAMLWEKTVDVGLRSNYIASCLAAKIMAQQNSGLIVNISSAGGVMSMFTPLYGVAKEANDRMAVEMGAQLKKYGVCVVSLWPGVVRTETMTKIQESEGSTKLKRVWHMSEHVTFTGKAILALAVDSESLKITGRVHVVSDLARKYSFTDVDGGIPPSWFSFRFLVSIYFPTVGRLIPGCLRLPSSLVSMYYSKF